MSLKCVLFQILLNILITTSTITNVAAGECVRETPPCNYTCHCADTTGCESAIHDMCVGTQGCERGWSGPKCQRENIVLDTNDGGFETHLGSSKLVYYRIFAFDGKLDTLFQSKYESNPYLWVNLDFKQTVNRIKIVTSAINPGWISGFRIEVDNSTGFTDPELCYQDPKKPVQEVHDITCKPPRVGQYVRIKVLTPKTPTTTLVVREMEIYSCADYWFGNNCDKACNCHTRTDICNKVNGHCQSGCPTGYVEPDCQECTDGKYGPGCTACGNCLDGDLCDKVNGRCTDGCAVGYQGEMCKTDGKYGPSCKAGCGNCLDGDVCHKVNGTCTGGCAAGYQGEICKTECHQGFFGQNCSFPCGNCLNESSCNRINGSCPNGCNPGYTPPHCANCADGFYGPGCSTPCGQCIEGDICNKTTGRCPGQCSAGDEGTRCQKGSTSLSGGTIGGIAGAAAGLIVLLIIVFIVVLKRRRKNKPRNNGGFLNEGYVLNEENDPAKRDEGVNIDVQETAVYANTTEVGRSPTAVYLTDLVEYVDQGLTAKNPYEQEFLKLPMQLIKSTEEANKEHNVTKCRYRSILPYDETRVVLEAMDGDPTTDFINASYVKGFGEEKDYIAAQGTTKHNVNDFWRMIWQEQTGKIVMLTNLVENGKAKVLQYWPDEGVANYGDISVEVTETTRYVDYCVRNLRVTNGSHVRNIKQLHFLAWPDHDVPRDTVGVIELRDKVNRTASRLSGPIVVHCSAGVGRTGTYIAFGNLMKQIESENEVDIFQTVVTLRNQRTKMVQTKEQYTFIHRLFRDGYLCRGSGFTSEQIASLDLDSPDVQQRIRDEYGVLDQISSLYSTSGNEQENNEVDTDQGSRFWFNTSVPGGQDFIEVTKFPQHYTVIINLIILVWREGSQLIATKIPDIDGKLDFWRLVYEQNCSSLILLNQLSQDHKYWPVDETPLKIGPFEITLIEETNISKTMTIRQLSVVSSEQREFADPHVLQHICLNGWSTGDKAVSSAYNMLSLKEQVMVREGQHKSGSVIVHCRDGIEWSGLYALCDFLLDRLKTESILNVLLSTKRFRTICPSTMNTLAHYRFCYQVMKAYLEKFNTYANFN